MSRVYQDLRIIDGERKGEDKANKFSMDLTGGMRLKGNQIRYLQGRSEPGKIGVDMHFVEGYNLETFSWGVETKTPVKERGAERSWLRQGSMTGGLAAHAFV